MTDSGGWNPVFHQAFHPLPVDAPLFAAASQTALPAFGQFTLEGIDRTAIGRDCMILAKTTKNGPQPAPFFGDRTVHSFAQFHRDGSALLLNSFVHTVAHQDKAAFPVLPTNVSEPKKVECHRTTPISSAALLGGETPELDQPCFLRVEFQCKLSHRFSD